MLDWKNFERCSISMSFKMGDIQSTCHHDANRKLLLKKRILFLFLKNIPSYGQDGVVCYGRHVFMPPFTLISFVKPAFFRILAACMLRIPLWQINTVSFSGLS